MNYHHLLSLFLVLCAPHALWASNIIMGNIQFPTSLDEVPMVRVYCGGRKVKCESDSSAKKISFTIPKGDRQYRFFLLITPEIHFERSSKVMWGANQNTIEYLKVRPDQPYRLFIATLTPDPTATKKNKRGTPHSKWIIEEGKLTSEDGRIPDETIIIRYAPESIQTVRAGSSRELPTVVLKSNLATLAGSEVKLHELSDALLIASIDSDTLHGITQEHIQFEGQRAVVAPVA